ncbi:lysophospholipid acyltransferase family protein [Puteibacter caeruleilacunae]|nr:lysophospholipid acyltransferase family protein [Puteibacter caeruleilacunae]
MELLNPKDLLQASPNLSYLGGEYFAKFLMYILRLNKINKIYDAVYDKEGIEFIDALIDMLGVKFEFDEKELERIPKEGGFITVSNHPYGGLDGILLLKLLATVRPDSKFLANFLLKKIEPLSDFIFGVNPFEDRKEAKSSYAGLKMAYRHLHDGGGLGVFPAGEVSSYDENNVITDRQWQYPVLKFIKKAEVPVIPVYFHGTNSRLFHIIGKIHPVLRTVKLPSELLNKKNKVIKIRIGKPIMVKEQTKFTDVYQYGRFLRAKTYSMTSKIQVKRFFNYSLKKQKKVEDIIDPIDVNLIKQEIKNIQSSSKLFEIKNYEVYCAAAKDIPNILNELGRLREVTFRAVGEGTNRSIDIDEFDLYYHQLFIWDKDEDKIVGAYRLGKGDEILREYGTGGFYLQSLFRMKSQFSEVLRESLELGRSFVVKEYQRKPMPLFLLWKGILYFLLKNPEYRYLIGPVSISNDYSKVSKELIIQFIMANHFDYEKAAMIKPRHAFKFKSKDNNINILMNNMDSDINKLDKFIGDLDQYNSGLPVLLKKYIKLNAKIVGFNVDPKFNDCLDGLIVLDVFDVPRNTIESLSKEVDDSSILEKFYNARE